MKLFATAQIADIDKYTIIKEPVLAIDLMERAATAICTALLPWLNNNSELVFFAGHGNNGGDALAMARMLMTKGYICKVYILDSGRPLSESTKINLQRLTRENRVIVRTISNENDFPLLNNGTVIIDGLFGSGLTRPLSGLAASIVQHINKAKTEVYSIDIPSGLMGEDNSGNDSRSIIRAKVTFTLQFPKISLLFPENEQHAGQVEIIDIGLHPDAIDKTETDYYLTSADDIRKILPKRSKFAHKGTFGHALLISGSYGKIGAAVLAAKGCIRSGAGLLTVRIPKAGYQIMQTAVPEAMCSVDKHKKYFSQVPGLEVYTAIGVGPGLGTNKVTIAAFEELSNQIKVPLVIDADGLNILAQNTELLQKLPANSVLTPHPGEFKRLFGETGNSWQRLQLIRQMAVKHKVIIVLKGAYTVTALPSGKVFFNPTGNNGMATGGSGDVLTGIILGLLAQGINPSDAAISGVWLHGMAADLAVREKSEASLIASDIPKNLGKAFRTIYNMFQQEI